MDVNAEQAGEASAGEAKPVVKMKDNTDVKERMDVDQGTTTTEPKPIKPIKRSGKDQKIDLATLNIDWATLASLASNLVEFKVIELGANEGHWIENKQYLPTSFTKMPWDERLCQENLHTTSAVISPSNFSSASPIMEPSAPEDEEVRESIFDIVPEIVLRLPHPEKPSNTIVLRMANPAHSQTEK